MTGSGLYVLILSLKRPVHTRIGALGILNFDSGVYLYIGSAQKNLGKRIERHKKRHKRLRWHIDYLRRKCRFDEYSTFPGQKDECALALKVATMVAGEIPHSRFGTSDCRCTGHLIRTKMNLGVVLEEINRKI